MSAFSWPSQATIFCDISIRKLETAGSPIKETQYSTVQYSAYSTSQEAALRRNTKWIKVRK